MIEIKSICINFNFILLFLNRLIQFHSHQMEKELYLEVMTSQLLFGMQNQEIN